MPDPFKIRYASEAADDIRGLRAFDRNNILDAIARHLGSMPTQTGKSRIKRMTQPFRSQYRLRVDGFRYTMMLMRYNERYRSCEFCTKVPSTTPENP